MSDIKWIKIVVDIFDDEKILLIEELPEADSIIVIWFKLLCLAGKQNNYGVFMINDSIPYTDKMLATIFRRKESTVRLALDTFERFGMIEIIDGVVTIPNWGKHQKIDSMEKRNNYMRDYMRNYREKQRLIARNEKPDEVEQEDCKPNSMLNHKLNVSAPEGEGDGEREGEGEKDNKTDSKESVCQTGNAVRQAINAWNTLEPFGIAPVKKIQSTATRYKNMNARIKEYGLEAVLDTIESIKNSDFLIGRAIGRSGKPFFITFDWFVLPNNFPKVMSGNYLNRDAPIAEKTNKEDDGFKDYE